MNKKIGTSMLFVNNNKEVMLLLRDNIPTIKYPNCWDIVSGQAEENETAEDAIIREVEEEIGLEIEKPELFKIYDFDDRLEHTFWQKTNLKIEHIDLKEGQKLKWFSEDEIHKLPEEKIGFNFKSVIIEFFDKQPFAM